MTAIFGTVLERLQGLFGKRYLIAGIGPVLLVVGLSLPLALHANPEIAYYFDDLLARSDTHKVLAGFLAALAIGVLGFVLFMANSWWRSMLERGPFGVLARWKVLRAGERGRRDKLMRELKASRADLVNLRLILDRTSPGAWRAALRTARQAPRPQTTPEIDPVLARAYAKLAERYEAELPIGYADLEQVFTLLEQDLRVKDVNVVRELDAMHIEFLDMTEYAGRVAERDFARRQTHLRRRFPADDSQITGSILGNVTLAGRDYYVKRYGMSLEAFWPLIEARAGADEKGMIPAALDEAKARVDFTISMNAMMALFTVVWLGTLTKVHADRIWFFVVGVLGLGSALLSYWLAIWNTYVFQSWVRSAVEQYRLQVLETLHMTLPKDSGGERALWSELTSLAESGEGRVEFVYKSPNTA
jgi:hypothetical protein